MNFDVYAKIREKIAIVAAPKELKLVAAVKFKAIMCNQ